MAQSRKRLFVVNVHKSVCHYSYVENIAFLVCKVLSRAIDVSVDGCAGPVRETVQEIRHYTKSVMTTLDNAHKLPEPSKEPGGFRIGFSLAQHFSSLWYFESKFRWGGPGLLHNLSGASGGFQKRLLIKNPFKKRLETIYKIVEANCKFQITPQSRILSFSLPDRTAGSPRNGSPLWGAWRKSWAWSLLEAFTPTPSFFLKVRDLRRWIPGRRSLWAFSMPFFKLLGLHDNGPWAVGGYGIQYKYYYYCYSTTR